MCYLDRKVTVEQSGGAFYSSTLRLVHLCLYFARRRHSSRNLREGSNNSLWIFLKGQNGMSNSVSMYTQK